MKQNQHCTLLLHREIREREREREFGRMLCITLEMFHVQMSSPWGYIYTFTSSINGGDLFDPTAKIVHPERSIQMTRILHMCGIGWNPLKHTLEKSREIQGILEYFRAVRDILPHLNRQRPHCLLVLKRLYLLLKLPQVLDELSASLIFW